MYKTLPTVTKLGLQNYLKSTSSGSHSMWVLARVAMYANKPMELLKYYLIRAFPTESTVDKATADKLFNPNLFSDTFFGDRIDAVEAFNNQMFNCKNSPSLNLRSATP